MSLRGLGIIVNADKTEGHFLRQYLSKRPKGVILDIGGNVGHYSMTVKEIAPDSTIYSFEPHPKTFLQLSKAAAALGFEALPYACGNENGKVKFYDYDKGEGQGTEHASLFKEVIEGVHHKASVEFEVDIIRLDDFITQKSITKIDLLKIDTEGNEMAVLKGAETALKSGKIEAIQIEFNEMNVVSRVFLKDFIDYLADYNFYRLLQDGYIPIKPYFAGYHEIFAWQNIIAVRKDSMFMTNLS
jgi:FkbM family methyltransferase